MLSSREGAVAALTKEYGLPSYEKWMEYYQFSLDHPDYSFTEIPCYFKASRASIYRAIVFMRSPHRDAVSKF